MWLTGHQPDRTVRTPFSTLDWRRSFWKASMQWHKLHGEKTAPRMIPLTGTFEQSLCERQNSRYLRDIGHFQWDPNGIEPMLTKNCVCHEYDGRRSRLLPLRVSLPRNLRQSSALVQTPPHFYATCCSFLRRYLMLFATKKHSASQSVSLWTISVVRAGRSSKWLVLELLGAHSV